MTNCLICSEPLPKGRKKFCCHQHAMKWHNDRQVWLERPDRELHNARKKATPELQAERMRVWRAAHPEAQKAIERRRRALHAEDLKQQNAKWREENREHLRDRSLVFHHETRRKTPWKHILRSRFRDALRRNIPFDLTPAWAEARWTGCCELTGIPFDLKRNVCGFYSPSIDKIDPTKGYLTDNCRFVLFSVNAFKNNGTDADMLNAAKCLVSLSKTCPAQIKSPET
jgi:hypothetical protein